jgi:hypothetical protein
VGSVESALLVHDSDGKTRTEEGSTVSMVSVVVEHKKDEEVECEGVKEDEHARVLRAQEQLRRAVSHLQAQRKR